MGIFLLSLLRCAAWPPPLLGRGALHHSSVGWWCLPSTPRGSGAFPPPALFGSVFSLKKFSGNLLHPKEEEERSTTKMYR